MKKEFIWPGIFFLASCWLFFIPIFQKTEPVIGLTFLIIGILMCTLSFYKEKNEKINKKYLPLFLIPLIISLIFIPFPNNLGVIVLTIAVTTYSFKSFILKNEKNNWIFKGLFLSGFILIFQIFLYPLYSIFVSHNHRIDILSPIISFFGNLFGLQNSVNNGIIYIPTSGHVYAFTTTYEKLGFFVWFNILVGFIITLFLLAKYKKIARNLFIFFAISFFYLIFRYIFILFLYTQTKEVNILFNQMLLAGTFLPLSFILMKIIPLKKIHFNLNGFSNFTLSKKKAFAIIFVFIFVFSIVGAFVFQDPGVKKQGRILIDEYHSDWEDTTKKLDTEWYGMLSTYNYYSWANWLDNYYIVEKNINNTLTTDLLNNYDILVLKCPTTSYSYKEIDDILSFVNNGGGLYLIGDHTNVFGMNFYLNQISEELGITFNTDATYELETGSTSTYKPDVLFPHVIVQNVEEFDFLTSCTLNAPFTSENVIIGNQLIGEPGTYSSKNFFRTSYQGSVDIEYGLLLQVATLKYGDGRVLAFTDSTCFSNFCVFMDGYKNFNLGAFEYLNRENSYDFINTIFVIAAIISVFFSLYLLKKEDKIKTLFIFILTGLIAFSAALTVFTHLNKIYYDLPDEKNEYMIAGFDMEHSNAVINSNYNLEDEPKYTFFSTFFVWTQRVNYTPYLYDEFESSTKKSDVNVIINPDKDYSEKELSILDDFIKNGGNVLIMDSVFNKESSTNQILQNYNISITKDYFQNNKSHNLTDKKIDYYLNITGEGTYYDTWENFTFLKILEHGKGKIAVFVDSYIFSDEIMGGPFNEPDEKQRKIYDVEYFIFEHLFK